MKVEMNGIRLSEKQKKVIDYLDDGLSTREIAEKINTGRKNVNNIITQLRGKGILIPPRYKKNKNKNKNNPPTISLLKLPEKNNSKFFIIVGEGEQMLINIMKNLGI